MNIKDIIPVYLKHLQAIGRANRTVKGARYDLKPFVRFLEAENIFNIEDLTADVMAEYQQELAFYVTAKGSLLTLRSQTQLLGTAKGFTRFLKQKEYLLHNPGEMIRLPKKPRTLPKVILSQSEVKQLINAADTQTEASQNSGHT